MPDFCNFVLEIMESHLDKMQFRKAAECDLPSIVAILRAAADRMLSEGKCQWTKTYPAPEDVSRDIMAGNAYVLEDDGKILAYGALVFSGEPAYDSLAGHWLTDGKYIVVHRLAVSQNLENRGLGSRFMAECAAMALARGIKAFRIDTNFDNERMLAMLRKNDFVYCGEVSYPQGKRMAFEKEISP